METSTPSNGHVESGLSVRNGSVENGDVDMKDAGPAENGTGPSKRKSRTSAGSRKSYADMESSDEDDKPLVRHSPSNHPHSPPPSVSPLGHTSHG